MFKKSRGSNAFFIIFLLLCYGHQTNPTLTQSTTRSGA